MAGDGVAVCDQRVAVGVAKPGDCKKTNAMDAGYAVLRGVCAGAIPASR